MSINTDANSVLMGSSASAAKFEQIGQTIGGRIIAKPSAYQVREYARNGQQGALKYYPSGDPIMGIYVDVQTELREDADDDGTRRLWIEKQRQLAAVREAVRLSGADGLERGGSLYLTWTGTEAGKGDVEAKTWAARYVTGAVGVPGGTSAQPSYQQSSPTVPVAQTSASAVPQREAPVTASPSVTATQARPSVPASVAAALANAGVDISAYDITPD